MMRPSTAKNRLSKGPTTHQRSTQGTSEDLDMVISGKEMGTPNTSGVMKKPLRSGLNEDSDNAGKFKNKSFAAK